MGTRMGRPSATIWGAARLGRTHPIGRNSVLDARWNRQGDQHSPAFGDDPPGMQHIDSAVVACHALLELVGRAMVHHLSEDSAAGKQTPLSVGQVGMPSRVHSGSVSVRRSLLPIAWVRNGTTGSAGLRRRLILDSLGKILLSTSTPKVPVVYT